MIGPNDLRDLLREDATEAPVVPANELLAGIEHKVKARRRTVLAGAAAAVVAVLVAALAIVPRFVDTSSPEPVEPIPDRPHLEFPAHHNSYPVLGFRVNEPGTSSIEWGTTVKRLGAELYVFCRVPAEEATAAIVVALNGEILSAKECKPMDWLGRPHYPPREREILLAGKLNPSQRGLRADEPLTISAWLQQGQERVAVAGAEFGVGFYNIVFSRAPVDPLEPGHPGS